MIAATVVAMGASVFADCAEPDKDPAGLYPVYQFKAALKTTKGVAAGVEGAAGICGEPTPGSVDVYRTKDSIALAGWLYAAENCTCDGWIEKALVWETKRKVQLTDAAFAFGLAEGTPNVIGKKCTEAEAFWTLTGTFNYGAQRAQTITLYGAGLGSFARKTATFSLSGNAAGTMSASYDLKLTAKQLEKLGAEACEASKVSKCDAVWCDDEDPIDSDTVVFGTWSMKYNKSMTTKYNKTLKVSALTFPTYVKAE